MRLISVLLCVCLLAIVKYCNGLIKLTFRYSLKPYYAIREILSAEDYDNATKNSNSSLPTVIDFQKSQCKPCKRVAPLFEALSNKYKNDALFFKVDADTSKEALQLMKANAIKTVPTFHIWRNGEKIESVIGAHIEDVELIIKDELNKLSNSKEL